jgi:hypothetical protein
MYNAVTVKMIRFYYRILGVSKCLFFKKSAEWHFGNINCTLLFYLKLKFAGLVYNIFVKCCVKLIDFRSLELVSKTNKLKR